MIEIKTKFIEQKADILVKIFQIVFAMTAIGVFLRERFDYFLFSLGLVVSSSVLTTAIILYYTANRGEK